MLRVAENRCGYSGYQCNGVGSLRDVFTTTTMLCDAQGAYRIDNFVKSVGENWIDNYKNLPESIEGFVITTDHLLDMGSKHMPPQEMTCVEHFNTTDGKVNGLYPSATTEYYELVDAKVGEGEWTMMGQNDTQATGTLPAEWRLSTFCFDKPTDILRPGILEPMIDTAFPPVGLDANISTDVAIDGAMLALVQLTKWRIRVDNRLNRISAALSRISALRNLLSAMNRQSICDDFRISLASGSPIVYTEPVDPSNPNYDPTDSTIPTYNIADGSVLLNGYASLLVTGEDGVSAPFYRYVNIYLKDPDDEGHYTNAEARLESSPNGDASFGIGGVKVVKGDHQKGTPTYWLYEIFQERCTLSVEMVRTSKEGFLYKLAGDAVPFKVVEGADCDEEGDDPAPEPTPEPEQ